MVYLTVRSDLASTCAQPDSPVYNDKFSPGKRGVFTRLHTHTHIDSRFATVGASTRARKEVYHVSYGP